MPDRPNGGRLVAHHTPCRHCRRRAYIDGRGLCRPCYRDPGTRGLYPSRRGATGVASPVPTTRLVAPEPTPARPGSAEKVAVLEARAASGEYLFHTADAPL